MEKLDIAQVVQALDQLGAKKRFSDVSHADLVCIWKDVSKYVEAQLRAGRVRLSKEDISLATYYDHYAIQSTMVPGVGTFYIKKTKDGSKTSLIPHFFPAHTWARVPGFEIEKTQVQGAISSETLRFAVIGLETKRSREKVEAGLKDITHALTMVLRNGSCVSLTMGQLGCLNFQNFKIKYRFTASFISSLEQIVSVAEPESTIEKLPKLGALPVALTAPKPVMLAPPVEYSVKAAVEPEASKKAVIEACEPQIIQNELEITEASSANESSSNPAQNDSEKPAVSQQIPETTKKPQTIAWDNDGDLEALVQETLSKKDPKMHTHPYSGDRLWNDEKCPICRIKAQPVVFESKELKVAKEKYHDKMLLTLSLDLDRELIRKAMEVEAKRHNTAIENSKYNFSKSIEKEQKSEQKNHHPMGNLFEHRELPPDKVPLQKELADFLHGQIVKKQEKAQKEKLEREVEEMQNQARFAKDLKTMEITVEIQKRKKWEGQRAALAEQIQAKHEAAENEKREDPTYNNPHARSESLMVLYKKEKAKQLYQEQLMLMRQKKEYQSKISEIDTRHSLDRLVLARKELEKDLKAIKVTKYQQRKSLEIYWKQQVGVKKNAL